MEARATTSTSRSATGSWRCVRRSTCAKGIDPRSVRLPDRILGKPPLKHGPLADVTLDNEAMLEDYYRNLQWDPATGRPTEERLNQLGLADVAAVIYAGTGQAGAAAETTH